nr:174_t:CDS:1 [Entrophospora candida]
MLTINNDINYEYSGPYEACSEDLIKGLICIFEKINNSITTETILSTKLRSERSGNNNDDDTFDDSEDLDETFSDNNNNNQGVNLDIGSGQINNDDNGKKYQFNNVLSQQPDCSSWIDRILYLSDIN